MDVGSRTNMLWIRCWRNRCSGLVVTMSLTVVITLIVIRLRLVDILHTMLTNTTGASSKPLRTVQLDVGDVAALLRRLQNTTTQDADLDDKVVRRVSRQLNEALKVFQQGRCRTPEVDFTDTGAWCQRAVTSLHIIDRHLAETLAHFFAGTTVLSLGDGTGIYRELVLNTSLVKRYDAYDGAPFSEETTGGAVHYLDLAVPQLWLERYDWVVCLEVIEHIPVEFESTVLDNVIRPATLGIVLSWALPTQPGANHVNARPGEYVENELRRRGLTLDSDATQRLRNGSELSWFQQNIVVYRKRPVTLKPLS